MAVARTASVTGNRNATSTTATMTVTATCNTATTGTDHYAVVVAEYSAQSDSAAYTLSVTYGGTPMVEQNYTLVGSGNNRAGIGIYTLNNPPTGSQNVVASVGGGVLTKTAVAVGGGVYSGVGSLSAVNSVSGLSVSVTSQTDGYTVAGTSNGLSLSGQNQNVLYLTGTSVGGCGDYISIQDAAGATSVTFNNTGSVSTPWSVGISLGTTSKTGSAAGAYGWAGAATGNTTKSGTASGAYTWAGTTTGKRTPKASSSGAYNFSGAAAGATSKLGTTSGAYGWSGTTAGSTTESGTATGSYTFTGGAVGEAPILPIPEGTTTGGYGWEGAAAGGIVQTGAATGGYGWSGRGWARLTHFSPDRILTIAAADRTLTVTTANRTLAVAAEDRTLTPQRGLTVGIP